MGWRDVRRCKLRLAVKRLDGQGQYETLITRDDGVIYGLRGVGHTYAIPHDIAHFVVERAVGLDDGFWGTIAHGAVFPTMHYRTGRRAPKAAARSHALLKGNAAKLAEAEVLVRLFNDRIEQGLEQRSPQLRAEIDEVVASWRSQRPAIGELEISRVFSDYAQVLAGWSQTSVGATLDLQWA
jgi:hypothetical protein